ncbi:MAG TPA: hypothetical protein VHU84_06885 [Lacipirellulaceae bacterium]|jgi:hypothetical protein|nr:hypothetical protein [Lacipirellulaceae bacterium]
MGSASRYFLTARLLTLLGAAQYLYRLGSALQTNKDMTIAIAGPGVGLFQHLADFIGAAAAE